MHEKRIPTPAFPGDDGSLDATLGNARISGTADETLAALAVARVFVALAARETDAADHGAEMGLVSIRGRDGRRALPVFSSIAALTAWNEELRPVAVEGARAAATAAEDGAVALIVDPGTSDQLVVDGAGLDRLVAVWMTAHDQEEQP